jgi:hypothetical protein
LREAGLSVRLSYLVAATLLLTYESIYLPFIVAPFFLEDQPRKLVKRPISRPIRSTRQRFTPGLRFGRPEAHRRGDTVEYLNLLDHAEVLRVNFFSKFINQEWT